MKIAVVGPGYAGLSLSLQFARSGVSVLASDVDVQKVQLLNHGKSYMKHIEPSVSAELVSSGKFSASADFNRIPDQSGGGGASEPVSRIWTTAGGNSGWALSTGACKINC